MLCTDRLHVLSRDIVPSSENFVPRMFPIYLHSEAKGTAIDHGHIHTHTHSVLLVYSILFHLVGLDCVEAYRNIICLSISIYISMQAGTDRPI